MNQRTDLKKLTTSQKWYCLVHSRIIKWGGYWSTRAVRYRQPEAYAILRCFILKHSQAVHGDHSKRKSRL